MIFAALGSLFKLGGDSYNYTTSALNEFEKKRDRGDYAFPRDIDKDVKENFWLAFALTVNDEGLEELDEE